MSMVSVGSRPHNATLIAVLAVGLAAACRPAGGSSAPPPSTTGSLPVIDGWEVAHDGITCRHPKVAAACEDGWCRIPPGCFVMGSPESEWARGRDTEEETATRLTRGFLIQQTESTRAQWKALGLPPPGVSASYGRDCAEPDCPVGNVTWFQALAFANEVSRKRGLPACYVLSGCTGSLAGGDLRCKQAASAAPTVYECKGYRLPTEAEWEYAARAGTRSAFYAGEARPQEAVTSCGADPGLEPIAWYCRNGGNTTHPAGRKRANAWGLFDTSGNALEWVGDSIHAQPGKPPWTDPIGKIEHADDFVQKGGNAWAPNSLLRSASRLWESPNRAGPSSGFRLVRTSFD